MCAHGVPCAVTHRDTQTHHTLTHTLIHVHTETYTHRHTFTDTPIHSHTFRDTHSDTKHTFTQIPLIQSYMFTETHRHTYTLTFTYRHNSQTHSHTHTCSHPGAHTQTHSNIHTFIHTSHTGNSMYTEQRTTVSPQAKPLPLTDWKIGQSTHRFPKLHFRASHYNQLQVAGLLTPCHFHKCLWQKLSGLKKQKPEAGDLGRVRSNHWKAVLPRALHHRQRPQRRLEREGV